MQYIKHAAAPASQSGVELVQLFVSLLLGQLRYAPQPAGLSKLHVKVGPATHGASAHEVYLHCA